MRDLSVCVCVHTYILTLLLQHSFQQLVFLYQFFFFCFSLCMLEASCCRFCLLKLFTWFIGTIFEKFSSHFVLCHSRSIPFYSILFSSECLHFRIVGFYVHNWYKVIFLCAILYDLIFRAKCCFLRCFFFGFGYLLVKHPTVFPFVYRCGIECVLGVLFFEN